MNHVGSYLGPDLSEIGAARSAAMLEDTLLDPVSNARPGNRSIRAVTKTGNVVTGRRLNEDTWSVQIIDSNEKLVSLWKPDLKEYAVIKSTMPSFKDTLTDAQRADVIAYLLSLRPPPAPPGGAGGRGAGRGGRGAGSMTRRTLTMLLVLVCLASGALGAQIGWDRLLNATKEPHNWLMYSGANNGWRHSPLTQITPANAKDLEMKWVFQVDSTEKLESSPLVVDGVMYITQPPNDIIALDATTGRIFWMYQHRVAADARVCCGRVNRGLAILGDTLFMGTIDAHLVAVNAKNGRLIWDTPIATAAQGYAIAMAPQVVKDKVIVGTAGGEHGIIGFVAAFDAATGKEVWRFNTIPGSGRARQRDMGRRFVEERRGIAVGDRHLRSRSEPDVLGRRESRA